MKPRILIVDDKKDLARGVALVLSELSDDITVAHSAPEAISRLTEHPVDLVFSDIKMPGMDGLSLLGQVRDKWPRSKVVLLTAYGTIESAVSAMKDGAFDYLTKPFDNDELVLVAERAWETLKEEDQVTQLRAEVEGGECFHGIFTRDPRMIPVLDTIRRAAPSNATVLIYGESGTGKELIARAIHEEGRGGDQPFVAFNAAALPDDLAEAELFGAKKGAYTGADRDRDGLFVEAQAGTLFIDELSSMSQSLQGKVLRAIQEREVRPLGGSPPVKISARIVAATNVEPRRLLADGVLRKDLYYRLAVVRVGIPSLRDRVGDIPLLADLFLRRMAPEIGSKRLAPGALRLLTSHDWPGNVRELQNVIERAALMCTKEEICAGDILLEDEDDDFGAEPDARQSYDDAKQEALERFQRRYVERLLAETEGNMSAAARKAGITRAALHRIVKRLGLSASSPGTIDGE